MSSDTSTGIRTVTIKDRQKTCRTCVEYDPEKEFCCVRSTAVSDPDVDGYVCPDHREAGHTCRKCRYYTARYVSEEEGNRAMCLKKMVSIRDPEACGYDCRMYEERELSGTAEAEVSKEKMEVQMESDRLYVHYFAMTKTAKLLVQCLKSGDLDLARIALRNIERNLDKL
jgi:hypothetical protein